MKNGYLKFIHQQKRLLYLNSKKILNNLINKYSTKKENIIVDQNSFSNFDFLKK